MKKLCKSKTDRKIDGVCAGIANYFNIDPTIVRLTYAILTLVTLGFLGVIIYIICMLVLPVESSIIDYTDNDRRN